MHQLSTAPSTEMSHKTIAIVQSNYIPWKGYFDLINQADEFIFYDTIQYTKRDWRNRNRYKSPQGTQWLSIPVNVKGKYSQLICETEVSDSSWAEAHWTTLTRNYTKAPFFKAHADTIQACYERCAKLPLLSHINFQFISTICDLLGITTKLSWSSDYIAHGDKNEKLIQLCLAAGATDYLSGPKAKSYMDETQFAQSDLAVSYMDYADYPIYPQRFGEFDHFVTILDLIFNVGAQSAPDFMRSFEHA